MSEVREIRALTGLRGIAAVYVVLFHYYSGVSFASPLVTLLSHGYLAVDLFFVLSGFVMTLNYAELFRGRWQWQSSRIFLSRRIARVYPLFVVTGVCAAILISRGWLDGTQAGLKGALALNVLMIQAWGLAPSLDAPSWSISAEWAAYIVFPLALWLGHNPMGRRARITLLCALASIAIMCWLPTSIVHRPYPLALLGFNDFRDGWPVFRCLPEFFLGIFTARVYALQKDRSFQERRLVAPAIAIAVLVLLAIPRSDFFFVAVCPILVLSLTSKSGLVVRLTGCKIAHHLGVISYSIYLVHELLGGLVAFVHHDVNRHGLQHGQTYGAVVAILLVYPISLAAYHFVEKPCRRLVRGLLERKSSAAPAPIGPLGIDTP